MKTTIFTDGSFDSPTRTCGWAYQVHIGGHVHHQEAGTQVPKCAEDLWNIAGECMAVIKGLEWAERCADGLEIEELEIVHDYEGVGKWFTTAWKARKPFTQWYVQRAHQLADNFGARVNFKWVRGHIGNAGNEAVDGLAKAAMQARREEKKAVVPIEQRLCVTGHRKLGDSYNLSKWEAEQMERLITKATANGVKFFISGGALRVDQSFALEVIRQRDMLDADVKLVMAIPCANQDKKWNAESKATYRDILKKANRICLVPLVSETHNGFISYEKLVELEASDKYGYTNDCMIARDRWMVDNVGIVMAFMARESSGTGKTVAYAKEKGRKVLHVDPITKTVKWLE